MCLFFNEREREDYLPLKEGIYLREEDRHGSTSREEFTNPSSPYSVEAAAAALGQHIVVWYAADATTVS